MIENYYKMSASKIGKILNLSVNDVGNFWYKNGLRGKQKRIYEIDEHCFDEIDDEYKAYTLGFIASDGCVSENSSKQNTIKITIHRKDEAVLEVIKEKVFKTEKPISHLKNYATLEISSDTIYQRIVALGLSPRKTYSNTYVELKEDLMVHFIRGYFDGDGSISTKAGKDLFTYNVCVSISGFEKNMKKIAEFLEKKNIFTTFTIDNRSHNKEDNFGSLCFPNKISKYCFLKFLYDKSNIFLQRKKDLAFNFLSIIENDKSPMSKITITYYNNAVLKES